MRKKNTIRYDQIVQNAMLDVVKKVLKDVEKNGLPGDHHFYLTYATNEKDVTMPDYLLEKYPEEITIVLQHEFEDLKILDHHFEITLWFNNVPAHLKIPFKAIRAFFDPSVKFGLQFNVLDEDKKEDTPEAEVKSLPVKETPKKITSEVKEEEEQSENNEEKSNIISLDSFRKK